MPAQRLRMKDRGLLRPGHAADITVFDPATVNDEATFGDPHRYPAGIPYVIVNGAVEVYERFTSGDPEGAEDVDDTYRPSCATSSNRASACRCARKSCAAADSGTPSVVRRRIVASR